MEKVTKAQMIKVIKQWVWFALDEGMNKVEVYKWYMFIDDYFINKDRVMKKDFKYIWNEFVVEWGVGDTGADSEYFEETWKDVKTGTLV
jgi:hypothetical protein